MQSFKLFWETFYGNDSQYARTGGGPTSAGADIMKRPAPIEVSMFGDTTGATGNQLISLFAQRVPIDFKVHELDNGLFTILVKYTKDKDFTPINKTMFAKKIPRTTFRTKDSAMDTITKLKFLISSIEKPKG